MKQTAGFTLIEMMIVVAIIAIIAAIAIPNMLRARMNANETSAIENLRTISSAQMAFHTSKKRFGSFVELTDPANVIPFLNGTWTEGMERRGYLYYMPVADDGDFECYADVKQLNITGTKFFRTDSGGSIRFNRAARATATDSSIDQQ